MAIQHGVHEVCNLYFVSCHGPDWRLLVADLNSDRRPDWSVLMARISCRSRLSIPNYAPQWEDEIIKVPPYCCVGKSHLFILRFSTTILWLNLYKCLRH